MDAGGELVTLALADLRPFSRHPYKVRDDDTMSEMVESVKQYGVLSPAIARPLPDGGYELVSGHRRKRACELAGLETMPVIVRELDDDAAAILVVDSNLQREDLLPSERALAYKLKLRNGQKFLTDGDRVKVTVRFRGREMAHTNIGEQLLRDFAAKCAEIANLDKQPKLEGRNMSIFLSPKTQTPAKKAKPPKAPKEPGQADAEGDKT